MFDRKYARVLLVIGLLLSSGLLAACDSRETAETSPLATPASQGEPTTPPVGTTLTSPLGSPTLTPAFVLTPPAAPNSGNELDPARTPVAIANAAIGPNREVVTIKNISDVEQSIGGWVLFNVAGGPAFRFPDDRVLQPGEAVEVYSAVTEDQVPDGAYFWTEEKIWNEFPADVLLLNNITRLMYWYVSYSPSE